MIFSYFFCMLGKGRLCGEWCVGQAKTIVDADLSKVATDVGCLEGLSPSFETMHHYSHHSQAVRKYSDLSSCHEIWSTIK